jgi:hypothetical protein
MSKGTGMTGQPACNQRASRRTRTAGSESWSSCLSPADASLTDAERGPSAPMPRVQDRAVALDASQSLGNSISMSIGERRRTTARPARRAHRATTRR